MDAWLYLCTWAVTDWLDVLDKEENIKRLKENGLRMRVSEPCSVRIHRTSLQIVPSINTWTRWISMDLNSFSPATQMLVQRTHEQRVSSGSNGSYSWVQKHGYFIYYDWHGSSHWLMQSAIINNQFWDHNVVWCPVITNEPLVANWFQWNNFPHHISPPPFYLASAWGVI